jgi:hypothetical protein
MLLTAKKRATITRRAQLTFDFISAEDLKPPRKNRAQRPAVEKVAGSWPPPADTGAIQPLADICVLLHDLTRKHVSPANFNDYTVFTQCSKILREMGAFSEPAAAPNPEINEHTDALIAHTPQYRRLRTRAIAGLATLADLGNKAPAKGSPDYQQGARDAYQYASEVAAMFLEDVENGV